MDHLESEEQRDTEYAEIFKPLFFEFVNGLFARQIAAALVTRQPLEGLQANAPQCVGNSAQGRGQRRMAGLKSHCQRFQSGGVHVVADCAASATDVGGNLSKELPRLVIELWGGLQFGMQSCQGLMQ